MTLVEVRETLQREGFRADVYSLNGSAPAFEGLVLKEHVGQWVIEHCERGIFRELAVLDSEDAACERMYELLSEHFRW